MWDGPAGLSGRTYRVGKVDDGFDLLDPVSAERQRLSIGLMDERSRCRENEEGMSEIFQCVPTKPGCG